MCTFALSEGKHPLPKKDEDMDKKMILGFPVDGANSREYLESLNAKYLYELACENEDAIIYDTVETFLKELNDGLVDTENNWWFAA